MDSVGRGGVVAEFFSGDPYSVGGGGGVVAEIFRRLPRPDSVGGDPKFVLFKHVGPYCVLPE